MHYAFYDSKDICKPTQWHICEPPRDGTLFLMRNPAWPVDLVMYVDPETDRCTSTRIAVAKDGKRPKDGPLPDPIIEEMEWAYFEAAGPAAAKRIQALLETGGIA